MVNLKDNEQYAKLTVKSGHCDDGNVFDEGWEDVFG